MNGKWIGAGLALVVLVMISHHVYADIATACPAGQVYGDITAALRSRGANPRPGTMGCTADISALGLNCPIGDPIQYLLGKRGPNSAGQLIPEYEIQRMGSSFACNLARFIDAGEKSGAVMKIYSGARNFRQPGAGADCQRVPCVPSTHELGCAADLLFNGQRQVETPQCPGNAACVWAHQNVNQFNLQFRLSFENGFRKPEPWHIELAGAQGPASLNSQGYCPGSPGTPFTSSVPTAVTPTPTPVSTLSNAMRAMFTPTTPPIIPSQPIQPVYDPSQYFSPPITTPTVPPPVTTPAETPPPQVVSDLISAIAPPSAPQQASSTATGTPIVLIDALGNKAGLSATALPTKTATQTLAITSITQSNTFTSQDLAKTPEIKSAGNPVLVLLEKLRQTLVRLLTILKPFGGARAPRKTISSETQE